MLWGLRCVIKRREYTVFVYLAILASKGGAMKNTLRNIFLVFLFTVPPTIDSAQAQDSTSKPATATAASSTKPKDVLDLPPEEFFNQD